MNTIDLKNKIAIITGGSGGIGLATAKRMVAYGATVVVFDINNSALEKALKAVPGLAAENLNLLDEGAVERAVGEVVRKHGRLDILVNCVGVEGVRAPIAEHSLADWRRIVDVNLTAPFIMSKYAVRAMQKNDYGRIIHLSSTAGKDGNAFGAAYSSAKAAVMALTKSMGKELATTGIRVNCVTPAALEGELFNRMDPIAQKTAISRIPMGRLGRVDEIAALICWMASEECSFSTGAAFDASGGRSTY